MATNVIPMVGEQKVSVNVTETGAKVPVFETFGNVWNEPITAREAIEKMGADFNVSKQPLIHIPQSVWDAIQKGEPIGNLDLSPANLIMTHAATVRDDKNTPLGIVGRTSYNVAQNVQSLAFIDMLEDVSGHKVSITSGGVLGNGEIFFLQGKLDKSCFLDGNKDEVSHYVTFVNSHSGATPLCVYMTPIRVICRNSLFLSLRQSNRLTFRHTANLSHKLNWEEEETRRRALEVFKQSVKFTDKFENAMLTLKADKVTKEQILDFTANLFIPKEQMDLYLKNNRNWDNVDEISTRAKNQMNALLNDIHSGIGQQGYYEGTKLWLLNGLTTYQQNTITFADSDKKFKSIMEGTENERLNKAYDWLIAA